MFIIIFQLGWSDNRSDIDNEIIATTIFQEPPVETTTMKRRLNQGCSISEKEQLMSLLLAKGSLSREDRMKELKKDILGC